MDYPFWRIVVVERGLGFTLIVQSESLPKIKLSVRVGVMSRSFMIY